MWYLKIPHPPKTQPYCKQHLLNAIRFYVLIWLLGGLSDMFLLTESLVIWQISLKAFDWIKKLFAFKLLTRNFSLCNAKSTLFLGWWESPNINIEFYLKFVEKWALERKSLFSVQSVAERYVRAWALKVTTGGKFIIELLICKPDT